MLKNENLRKEDKDKIETDLLALLHEHLLTSIPIAFLCATIIFLSVYPVKNIYLTLSWFIVITITFLLRLAFYFYYRKNPKAFYNKALFMVGVTLSAILWGFAGTILMPVDHPVNQTIIIVVIAGITAGGIQTLQASRAASAIFIIFSVLPLDIWLLMQNTKNYYLLSVAIFFYIIFMLATSKRGYDLIISAYRLGYENININSRLENTNQLLKVEIKKHTQTEKSLARLAEIVEFSKDAMISLDDNGLILTWNKGAESLYGYNSQQVVGKSIAILDPKNDISSVNSVNEMLESTLNNVSIQNVEIERRHRLGHLIPVSVTLSPIKNSNGEVIGISSIDRDISERKEIDKMKNEFISVVSHELRTPLTSIKGSIGILLKKYNEMSQQKIITLLDIAYNNCDRLIRLINDILDIEKIESGKFEFKFDRVDLYQLIKNSIDQTQPYAEKYEVKISFSGKENLFVSADHDCLIQVMTNLISNAVKFSHPHSKVNVLLEKINDTAKVSITDFGEGIPEKFREKIFNKFTQADLSSARPKDGTGLGLSICKTILEKHQSSIHFTSELGKGTTFYFSLPLINADTKNQFKLNHPEKIF